MNTPNNILTNEMLNQESNKSTHYVEKIVQDTQETYISQTLEIINDNIPKTANSSPQGENATQIPNLFIPNIKQPIHWSHAHAIKLIKEGVGRWVIEHLDTFPLMYNDKIAMSLIETPDAGEVARCIEKFPGIQHYNIAMRLIEKGYGSTVMNYLEKFKGINHKEIAMKLIEAGYGGIVVEYLKKFKGINHKEIAMKLIKRGEGKLVTQNLGTFIKCWFQN